MFKELGLKVYDWYTYVFDHNINPLKNIKDPTDRAKVMAVLFTMWSTAFAFFTGTFMYLGLSMYGHGIFLFMVFFTASVFKEAEEKGSCWFLEMRRKQQIPPKEARRVAWDLEKEG